MSSSEACSNIGRAVLRVLVATSVLSTTGCAYFHPAFVTQPSRAERAALAGDGILVCERVSLTRKDCTVLPRGEVTRALAEALDRR